MADAVIHHWNASDGAELAGHEMGEGRALILSSMGASVWWLGAPGQLKLPAMLGLVVLGGAVYAGCLLAFGFRPRDFSRRAAK